MLKLVRLRKEIFPLQIGLNQQSFSTRFCQIKKKLTILIQNCQIHQNKYLCLILVTKRENYN